MVRRKINEFNRVSKRWLGARDSHIRHASLEVGRSSIANYSLQIEHSKLAGRDGARYHFRPIRRAIWELIREFFEKIRLTAKLKVGQRLVPIANEVRWLEARAKLNLLGPATAKPFAKLEPWDKYETKSQRAPKNPPSFTAAFCAGHFGNKQCVATRRHVFHQPAGFALGQYAGADAAGAGEQRYGELEQSAAVDGFGIQ
jgi:hypothetical protein